MEPTSERTASFTDRSDVFWMMVAAVVFGYCGFGLSWVHRYTAPPAGQEPQLLIMVAVLMWTFRVGTVAFIVAGLLTMVRAPGANLVYSATSLLASLAIASVALWDLFEPRYTASMFPPFLLMLFAIMLGFGSWRGISSGLAELRARPLDGPAEMASRDDRTRPQP